MKQETIVRLKIVSLSRSPETITTSVGLECDRKWHAGEMRKHTTIIEKNNGWVLHSGLPKSSDLETHLMTLLDMLEPAKDAIRELSLEETVEISIVVYSSSIPSINIRPSTIARMAGMGAGLDVDLYIT